MYKRYKCILRKKKSPNIFGTQLKNLPLIFKKIFMKVRTQKFCTVLLIALILSVTN
jgi:hypothetical protein